MDWFVIVLIICVIAGISQGIDKFKKEEVKAENQELINKALKHYAETKGIK